MNGNVGYDLEEQGEDQLIDDQEARAIFEEDYAEMSNDPTGLSTETRPPRYKFLTFLSIVSTVSFFVCFACLTFLTDSYNWLFSFVLLGIADIFIAIAFSGLLKYYKTIGDRKTCEFINMTMTFMALPLLLAQIGVVIVFEYSESCKSDLIFIDDPSKSPSDSYCQCDYSGVQHLLDHVSCYYNSVGPIENMGDLLGGSLDSLSNQVPVQGLDMDDSSIGTHSPGAMIDMIVSRAQDSGSSTSGVMNNLMEASGDTCGDRLVSSEELFHRVASTSTGCKMMDTDTKFGYPVNVVFGELCSGEVTRLVSVSILTFFEIYLIAALNFISKFQMHKTSEMTALTELSDNFEIMDDGKSGKKLNETEDVVQVPGGSNGEMELSDNGGGGADEFDFDKPIDDVDGE